MEQTERPHSPGGWRTLTAKETVGSTIGPSSVTPPPFSVTAITSDHRTAIDRYKRAIQKQIVDAVGGSKLKMPNPETQRNEIRSLIIKQIAQDPPPAPVAEHERIAREILDDILGLGPLEPLFADPSISDILVNGPQEVYVERRGVLELTDVQFRDDDHVIQVIRRIVERINRRVDDSSPMVDARLPDGSRVNAIIPPLSLRGPAISIRRFGNKARTLEDLIRLHMLTPEIANYLRAAVKSRLNVVISGGTGSGKTTLLNALSHSIPDTERIVTIEDSAELKLQQRHVLPLEARPANIEGKGAVTVRDLVRNALRMRPDRIVIGECRGSEAFDMLQAMNTGHNGSLTTLHANTPRDVLTRLETMVLMAGYDLPVRVVRQQIASAVNVIVQTNRLIGGLRRVTSVTEITGMEQDVICMQELFNYQQQGMSPTGTVTGFFQSTGVRTHYSEQMNTGGCRLGQDLFAERILHRDY